ncbi:signal peptidase I [Patescibacteria group bacterium]|nr:signal peptidase I [Patescibacteria group bacterium]
MKIEKRKDAGFALGSFILEFVQSIVLALSVFVILYLFVTQPNEVKGSSMLPNFVDGEFLLTDKVSYRLGDPKRGDVVVFKAPPSEPCSENECEYIKRIIGLPGDKVMVKEAHVYVNGKMLPENFLPEGFGTQPGAYSLEGVEKIVPEGYYLCFGDNRTHSRDGREFGPVEKGAIVGKAFFKYWPPAVWGLVPKLGL